MVRKTSNVEFGPVQKNANLVETLLVLTFFPGSPQIHENRPNRSFSNREHAFSPCLRIFEFWNFSKLAGDGGVGRAGFPVTPPGPPREGGGESVNRQNPNKERTIFIIYPGRFHPQNLPPPRFHARNLPPGTGDLADFARKICENP